MKTILFDLDSTLLQMDQDLFLKYYFKGIYDKFLPYVEDINIFMDSFNKAAYNIVKNDGSKTNQTLFFDDIKKTCDLPNLEEIFYSYYQNEFKSIKSIVDNTDYPKKIVEELKKKGYNIYLATNPLFPRECTYERIKWAGLNPEDFKDITTYENCTYCKPKLEYFLELANKNNFDLNDCIMIGNDVEDDFLFLPDTVKKILVTNYLINRKNKDISMYEKYTIEELYNYIKKNM